MLPALARALRSLDGLSVADAFGERFFGHATVVLRRIARRELPASGWRWTDDTAMALSIVELLASRGRIEQDALAAAFARRFRAEPHRGYGGTAREILDEIAAGRPWREVSSAVFDGQGSMGNGGAMRAAPIGAYFAGDLPRVIAEARASAEVTHMHPEGQAGAIAVAVAASCAATGGGASLLTLAAEHCPPGTTRAGLERALGLVASTTPERAAELLGSGSNVISEDTVPFALWCAARHHDDYEEALWTTVAGLGDRDTTCAIAGGVVALSAPELPGHLLAAREPLGLGI